MNVQMTKDKYGRLWPAGMETCPTCGQPDNCGDCNHERLPLDDVLKLGGKTS